MNITIDLKTLLLIIICAAVVVLVVYLVKFLKSVMATLERTNKVMDDVAVVTSIAADRSKDVDNIVSGVAESVNGIKEAVSGKQGIVQALAAIAKAAVAIKNAVEKSNEKK